MTQNSTERGIFSAAPSALGYFFQCRYALLESLKRIPDGVSFNVYIETLDDVVFEEDGHPPELLQTKHHINRPADLTDASPDLWKTLRIWMEGIQNRTLPPGSEFFLITTAQCGEGSAASYLRGSSFRNVPKAIERLNSTARTSTNQTNARSYEIYKALDLADKVRLADSIVIVDAAPTVDSLEKELRRAAYFAVSAKHIDSFLSRLEGWWLRRVIEQLSSAAPVPIRSEEIESERINLREQFKMDNLPIDQDIIRASVDGSGYTDETFVTQLRLIGLGSSRILIAIRNFFRAQEQRSRWMREDLLLVGELERYETHLVEEWESRFESMRDALVGQSIEANKVSAAQGLYVWVEQGQHQPIRPAVLEASIARGTYHILADDKRVGWHVEFQERLVAALSAEVTRE